MSEENEDEKFTIDGVGHEDMDLSDKIEHVFKTEVFQEEISKISSEIESLEEYVKSRNERVNEISGKLDELDDKHNSDIEEIQERVVQVARMANDNPKGEDYEYLKKELDDVSLEIDEIQSDIHTKENEIDRIASELEKIKDEHKEFNHKLDGLMRSHVELKKEIEEKFSDISTSEDKLEELREMAQDEKITKARCNECKGTIIIPYLDECKCSNCGSEIVEIRNRLFRPPLILTENT